MSMRDWIARYVPGGIDSQLGPLIARVVPQRVRARDRRAQRAQSRGAARLAAALRARPRDERARLLRPALHLGAAEANRSPRRSPPSLPAGSIQLRAQPARASARCRADRTSSASITAGRTRRVYADRVVLAIPVHRAARGGLLRRGFDSAKANAIENLGYGYHTKLHLQFDRRAWMRATHPWPEPTTGQIWTTLRVQSALDYSLGQSGGDGLIEVFTAADPAMLDTPPMPYAQLGDPMRCDGTCGASSSSSTTSGPASRRRGTARRRSATRKPIRIFAPATRAGSSVSTRRSRDTKRARRAACISPASTRRSRIKASWRAAPSRAFAPPARFSPTTAFAPRRATSVHIIGTAGHVDHGKSALIAALTGTNPDRWTEERARGMTLDLGFAHLRFDDGVEGGIVDVPGHERFLHNMLAGAAGMELLAARRRRQRRRDAADARASADPAVSQRARAFSSSRSKIDLVGPAARECRAERIRGAACGERSPQARRSLRSRP